MQAADIDQDELADARLSICPQMESKAQDRISRAGGGRRINFWNLQSSTSDTDKLLGEGDMADQHEEQKLLRRIEKRQWPKREARVHQQER